METFSVIFYCGIYKSYDLTIALLMQSILLTTFILYVNIDCSIRVLLLIFHKICISRYSCSNVY